ncbi:histidine kinase [Undibacterium sp. FT31W]|uniref:Histidine kinase n=1 Tax=Undibacterium griseum TaxID=2762295 RepID=A0ABR6YLS9_9BURK|nr:histidine kinase [Undibacterium griseum]
MRPALPATTDEPVIPDCCNIGVIFRVLLGVSLMVLMGLGARGDSWDLVLQNFIEISILIDLIVLLSLLILCAGRRYAYRHPFSAWAQRLLCMAVPGLISFLSLVFMADNAWFAEAFPHLDRVYLVTLSVLLGGLFQHYFELRMKAYSPALGEARLQALQARIRPHFLFNSLNTALSLIRHEPRRAETVLEDLSDLFRVLMRDTRYMTSLLEELQLCRQYLAIESLRLGDRLHLVWDMPQLSDNDLRQIEIPALLLQPLLENAVHYGVEPAVAQATIEIHIQRTLDKIDILIRNPVHPHRQSGEALISGNQMALENIRQRLALLYDMEAALQTAEKNGFFEVRIYFPVSR